MKIVVHMMLIRFIFQLLDEVQRQSSNAIEALKIWILTKMMFEFLPSIHWSMHMFHTYLSLSHLFVE
jgi:hypothetical protein